MHPLRANRAFAFLALAALAMQIALSFGHVHLDGIKSNSPALITNGSTSQVMRAAPAQHQRNAGDHCAICAAIFLAANSFVPQAPELLVPSASGIIEHFDRVTAAFLPPWRAPFQSRAPPL